MLRAKEVGHLWRTTGDIGNVFDGVKKFPTWSANGVMTIVDINEPLQKYAGPGHWNDPDMMEVGNGQTATEDRTHFSLWCMMAAPLMAGNDIRNMSRFLWLLQQIKEKPGIIYQVWQSRWRRILRACYCIFT